MVSVNEAGTGNDARRRESIFSGAYRITTIGIVISVTLIAFDAMAVATALPTAARQLHGLAYYGWAFTGFLIASTVGMVVSGLLSDRHGPRRALVTGTLLFVAGLVVGALAPTMFVLVLGRLVQGAATGLVITAMYVVLGEVYPDAIRPKMFTAVSAAWVVPGLVGPLLSGWVTQAASWRWVFGALAPCAVVGGLLLIPSLRVLADAEQHRVATGLDRGAGRRRLALAVLAALGVAAVANAGEHPGVLAAVLAVLGLAALLAAFAGLLPAGTARLRPGVPAAIGYRGVSAGVFASMESVVPLTLTAQRHYSPTEAGVPLMLSAFTWALASWIQGRMARPNRSLIAATGLVCIAVGGAAMALVATRAVPAWVSYPGWMAAGFGAGLTLTTASLVMLESTTDADRGSDSSSLQLADSTTSALLTAFAGAMVAAAAHGSLGYSRALLVVFAVLAAIAVAAVAGVGNLRVVRRRSVAAVEGP